MATQLFHISDVHFGVEDRAALAEVAREVEHEKPDALVCTGDLTQRATHRQYAQAADWFAQFEVPVWLDVGNHDMPYFNLWERFTDPYRRFLGLHRAVAETHFETDDLVLIRLNTTVRAQARWPWSDGVVKPDALEATLRQLAQFKGDKRRLIVTAHHPLHGPEVGGPTATIGGNEAYDRLVDHGMDAIMTGHIHQPFNEHRPAATGAAQVIGAGTLSTRLRHGAPPSYNVLTATGSSANPIEVETRIIGGAS
ncbi:MAG: metallophosphoesterase [Pseudomonadota bacterium]